MKFFKDNRIDGEYEIPDNELKAKFEAWRTVNTDYDGWPFERIAGVFLMELGTLDTSDSKAYDNFIEVLRD